MHDLILTLGLTPEGEVVRFDLTRLPHLLIGGVAGSGKTACIESLLAQLQFVPKSELLIHRLNPRVPDAALSVLRNTINEMNHRFDIFHAAGVQQISQYAPPLPRLLLVLDEFAPLMKTHGADMERLLIPLARLGRSAGIHLILATQHPNPEVITGLIRANIPSRIAFRTASALDSRTLLDHPGAEKLARPGDMLFCPIGQTQPFPVHSTAE